MPPTKQEYLAYQESYGSPYKPSIDIAFGLAKTAAISMEHVTNDPHWDRFLSYLQGMYETAKVERERYRELCTSLFVEASLREAQCHFHRADAELKVLEKVMGLPTQLKESFDSLRNP